MSADTLLAPVNSISVVDGASLSAAIDQADAALAGNIAITFANDITETATLDAVNLQAGVTLTIDGQGHTLNGSGQFRGLFAYAGATTVQNLNIDNTVAIGGQGGGEGAGGGAGLGGGLFVAGSNPGLSSGANVTLVNVTFSGDGAVGGAGQGGGGYEGHYGPYGTDGGGGGLGGNGGSYDLHGGGGGGIGGAGNNNGTGYAGIVPGAQSGGAGALAPAPAPLQSNAGGANGGGGGSAFGLVGGDGGGGGIGGGDATSTTAGAGGFGGGGGGGYDQGGSGGFGGGGASHGGNGGFGGGGGDYGTGGFGADRGSNVGDNFPGSDASFPTFAGGGGLGAGGAVFVQAGGTLTIGGGSISQGKAAGGLGGVYPIGSAPLTALIGEGLGAGIFLQGDQTITFAEAAGQSTVIGDVIADQTGTGGTGGNAGSGAVSITGPGTVVLNAANSYTGGTLIGGGTLELAMAGAAGAGAITFAAGAAGTLRLDPGVPVGATFNPLLGFTAADILDLAGLSYAPNATATITGHTLSVSSGGATQQLLLGDVADGTQFQTASDGSGGISVTEASAATVIGSGPDTIGLHISEDAYKGDAQFTVAVDGVQVGGVQTATVLHGSGQSQLFDVMGSFGSAPHAVTIDFTNDLYGGTADTDRNLYVNGIDSLGVDTTLDAALYSTGSVTFGVNTVPPTGPVTIGSGPDSLVLDISEDAYASGGADNALFTISVDGVQIGPVQTATASHALGQTQAFTVQGTFGTGPHTLGVNFLNDAYGGSPDTDRNLYIDGVQDGSNAIKGLALYSAGLQNLTVQAAPTSVTLGAGPDSIGFYISEDAAQGDAQFTLSIGGVQIGGVQTATTLHGSGQDELFTVLGNFGVAPQTVVVNFLNGAPAGTNDNGRHLYVDHTSRSGAGISNNNAELSKAGPVPFSFGYISPPTGPVTVGAGPDSLTLNMSEGPYTTLNTYDDRFTISVDGVQVGGTETVTAFHSTLATQAFTVNGNFGAGPHTVGVTVSPNGYNGAPTDRTVYLDSIQNAGLTTLFEAQLAANSSQSFTAPGPDTVLTGSNLVGPASGNAVLNGTAGADLLVAQGGHNTINGLGGNDTVTGSTAGGDVITVGAPSDTASTHDNITISGAGNAVTTGNEAVTLSGSATGTEAKLGDGANNVQLDGVGNTVVVGNGVNTLAVTGGGANVLVSGYAPTTGQYSDAVTVSGTNNTVSANESAGKYSAFGTLNITGGTGNGNFDLGDGTSTVHTDGLNNSISFGSGNFDVTAGSGYDTVQAVGVPTAPNGTIRLAGVHNSVTANTAMVNVIGGDGSGTFNFAASGSTGVGTYSLTTGGTLNTVNETGGSATLDAGSGSDTISLYASRSSLTFHGSGDMLFLHVGPPVSSNEGGSTAVVNDQSTDLQVFVDPGVISLTFSQFAAAGVVHLLGGAGGYTTADQVLAALTPEGTGGARLAVDTGVIHFANAAQLTSANFAIR